MNKYKTLGVVFMVSTIVATLSAYKLGYTDINWALDSTANALLFISGLCIMLFGSLLALTADKLR